MAQIKVIYMNYLYRESAMFDPNCTLNEVFKKFGINTCLRLLCIRVNGNWFSDKDINKTLAGFSKDGECRICAIHANLNIDFLEGWPLDYEEDF